MTLRFATVCSGIEAASTAWKPLGWQPVFFSEIDKFPCAVLAHHYPDVPNHGDMTKFKDWPDADIDVLAGGTPCQSFSNAGLRAGLDDPRGQLMLTFGAIAARYRPRWLVWENVPGVLSSNGGRDFGAFLGLLGFLGYGFAYRVLDAQYVRVDGYARAVPQRRQRVFVVGCLGDWRSAAAVLLERESLRGDPAPRRKAGARSAARPAQSLAIRGREGIASAELGGEVANAILTPSGGRGGIGVGALLQADSADSTDREALLAFGGGNTTGDIAVSSALTEHGTRMDFDIETFVSVAPTLRAGGNRTGGDRPPGTDVDTCETLVAHTLRGDGFDASEDGTGRGTPLVPVPFDTTQITSAASRSNPKPGDPCHPLVAGGHAPAIAFDARQSGIIEYGEKTGPLDTNGHTTGVQTGSQVRRLTPRECERLMGFPDDYTLIPHRGKDAADGPRYKALGNSWAINCARWVGQRIQMVNDIKEHQ